MSLRKISFAIASVVILAIATPLLAGAVPATCTKVQAELTALEEIRAEIQGEMSLTPSGRAYATLARTLRATNEKIALKKRELTTCTN
jgi:hypothetical protein